MASFHGRPAIKSCHIEDQIRRLNVFWEWFSICFVLLFELSINKLMVKSSTLLLNLHNFNIFGCERICMYETVVAIYYNRPQNCRLQSNFNFLSSQEPIQTTAGVDFAIFLDFLISSNCKLRNVVQCACCFCSTLYTLV